METPTSFADQLADAARSMQGWSSTQLTLEKVVLIATEIMPGIDPARDIVAASGGRVQIAPDAITLPLSLLADAPMGWGK